MDLSDNLSVDLIVDYIVGVWSVVVEEDMDLTTVVFGHLDVDRVLV